MSINAVTEIEGSITLRHVIISVADKSGLEDLVASLVRSNENIRIYSTGGTFSTISEILGGPSSCNLVAVTDYTGQPEMQGGLVKTLDFKVYLGLLSESYNKEHMADIERVRGVAFDMVVGNLYPFRATIEQIGATVEDARGNIDIGGPCMLRAAAKNFLRVAAVCRPSDYPDIIRELETRDGALSLETRYECARIAFRHTADYDTAIADYLLSKDFESLAGIYTIK